MQSSAVNHQARVPSKIMGGGGAYSLIAAYQGDHTDALALLFRISSVMDLYKLQLY